MRIQKAIITLFIVITAGFIGINHVNAQTKDIIYVSEGCPHCAKVEAFVEKNNLTDKIEFRDTAQDTAYSDELNQLFDKYGTAEEERGVPTYENNDQIYSGDTPIIEQLITKYSIENPVYGETLGITDYIFIGFGGLILISVLGYSVYSSINKKK